MAALIIPSNTPFGGMTNQITSRMIALNTQMARIKDAIATASSGYTGVDGTQFEASGGNMMPMAGYNNFGVVPDPATPGANGLEYSYAVNVLVGHWETFWAVAEASIAQLDNGGSSM
jgi:hypothetical protein